MEKFLAGIVKFQNDVFPASRQNYEQLADGQSPETLYIGCSDSRVVPNELMQAKPGDLFVCRTAGNLVPPYGAAPGDGVGATVEYAVEVLKVRHIVVCGHSDCGAMKALIHPEKAKALKDVSAWLRHADRVGAVTAALHGELNDRDSLAHLIEENVITQIDHLRTYPCVDKKVRAGNLQLHGLVFDIRTGGFRMLDAGTLTFLALEDALERRPKSEAIRA